VLDHLYTKWGPDVATDNRDVNDNQDATPDQQAAMPPAENARLSAKGLSRRRFTRVGAGATGVLLTLHSQPGMACTFCGISPSSAVSAIGQNKQIGTLSHRGPQGRCAGVMPNIWAGKTDWTGTNCKPDTLFKTVFTCQGFSAAYADLTCQQVVAGAACDKGVDMGKFIMAAYLNVASGLVTFISPGALYDVWNEWSLKGVYEPMAGQSWKASDIVYYLRGTMD